MHSITRSRLTTASGALTAAAALVVLVSACGGGDTDTDSPASPAAAATPSAGSEAAADADHNAADVMFVQMMIPHHEQAVVMADDALSAGEGSTPPGEDPAVVDLATRIKAAQQPEIDQMTAWLDEWGMSAMAMGDDMAGMDHSMGGMMSEEDMIELRAATGADFDRLWLEMMIEHHAGAIDMAEDVLADGSSPEVKALAEQIIESQQSEIAEMEALLANA